MSPCAGSMYHGSSLLLSLLGPLTVKRRCMQGLPDHLLYSLVSVIADVISAMLIRVTGQNLRLDHLHSLESLDLVKQIKVSEVVSSEDVADLIYLRNPFTIVACVGLSTSPIEIWLSSCAVMKHAHALNIEFKRTWISSIYVELERKTQGLFPWLLLDGSLHLICLFILLFCLFRKLFMERHQPEKVWNQSNLHLGFSWSPIIHFAFWALLWSAYALVLCGIYLKQFGGLWETFKSTYGFILPAEDLSPNMGVLWYFFAVGDSALYLGLLGCFVNELADMQFSFFLVCGYVGVFLLSPVMHNLWIWRIILFVEGVIAMLNHDRKLRNLTTGKPQDAKS